MNRRAMTVVDPSRSFPNHRAGERIALSEKEAERKSTLLIFCTTSWVTLLP